MKKILISNAILIASSSVLSALTIQLGNITSGSENANGVINSSGTLLVGSAGTAVFGSLGSMFDSSSITSPQQIMDSFTPFGNSRANFNENSGLVQVEGAFSLSGTSADTSFNGQNIAVFITAPGSGPSGGDEFLLLELTEQFSGVENTGIIDVNVAFDNANVLIGNQVGTGFTDPSDDQVVQTGGFFGEGNSQPAFQTAGVIPEPSSTLLLGGSLLALGLRRRRS